MKYNKDQQAAYVKAVEVKAVKVEEKKTAEPKHNGRSKPCYRATLKMLTIEGHI